MTTAPRIEVARVADQLERSLRGGAWQGPALLEALAGVDGGAAHRRPLPGTHTIAEIVGHVTYWLDAGRLRLAGAAPDSDDDWPISGDGSEAEWRRSVEGLERAHRELQAALAELDDARLDDAVEGSDPTARGLLLGLLQHNAYHAGQLVLLARAAASGRR